VVTEGSLLITNPDEIIKIEQAYAVSPLCTQSLLRQNFSTAQGNPILVFNSATQRKLVFWPGGCPNSACDMRGR
jgi:hypothetical protein